MYIQEVVGSHLCCAWHKNCKNIHKSLVRMLSIVYCKSPSFLFYAKLKYHIVLEESGLHLTISFIIILVRVDYFRLNQLSLEHSL